MGRSMFHARIVAFAMLAGAVFALPAHASGTTLTLYSRLSYAPAVAAAFTHRTGIRIRLRRPPPAGLMARMIAEGHRPRWSLAWFYGAASAITLDRRGLLAHGIPMPVDLTPQARRLAPADGAFVPTGLTLAAVLVAPRAAPFAPPANWTDLAKPAYRGLVGINDPVTSDQSVAAVISLLHAGGGWPGGKGFVVRLHQAGLHIYTDTATTLAALRSGAIQLAIVRGSAGYHYADHIDRSLRVIVPQPETLLPAVIAMAHGLDGARRSAALSFIAFAESPAGQRIAHARRGDDAAFQPAVKDAAVPDDTAMPATDELDPQHWAGRQAAIIAWFSTAIVGPSL